MQVKKSTVLTLFGVLLAMIIVVKLFVPENTQAQLVAFFIMFYVVSIVVSVFSGAFRGKDGMISLVKSIDSRLGEIVSYYEGKAGGHYSECPYYIIIKEKDGNNYETDKELYGAKNIRP